MVALGPGKFFTVIPTVVVAVILLRLGFAIFDKWTKQMVQELEK